MLNNNYERDGQTFYSNDIQVENIEILELHKENNEMSEQIEIDDNNLPW